jgi:hypothetical protein
MGYNIVHKAGNSAVTETYPSLPDCPAASTFPPGAVIIIAPADGSYTITRTSNVSTWYSRGHSALLADRPSAADFGAGEWTSNGVSYVCDGSTFRPSTKMNALQALSQAVHRRVDFVMLGDSNQSKDGYGFDYGFAKAFADRFGLYASGIIGGNTFGVNSGASTYQEERALAYWGYRFLADGSSVANSVANGIIIRDTDKYILNPSSLLRCHFAYSTFSSGAGSFKPGVRIEQSPWTVLQMSAQINTNTGVENYTKSYFDLSAGDREGLPLGFKWMVSQQLDTTGPFLSYYLRVEDVNKNTGVSCHTFYNTGGASLYDMAATVSAYTDKNLVNYFREVRSLQIEKGYEPIIIIYINSGLNDRNETSVPSLGSIASYDGDSDVAYYDNLEAIIARISAIFRVQGWGENELYFLLCPSHPVSDPDDSELISYRTMANKIATMRSNVSFVDLNNVTSSDEILANNWYYNNNTDKAHLTQAGYVGIAAKIVELIK